MRRSGKEGGGGGGRGGGRRGEGSVLPEMWVLTEVGLRVDEAEKWENQLV